MHRQVSESSRKFIGDFFGGAVFTLAKGAAVPGAADKSDNMLVKTISTDSGCCHFLLKRSAVPFTETERRISAELAGAIRIFFGSGGRDGDIAYFRTALLSSIMDVTIYRHLRCNSHRAFWPIQKLLQVLKELSHQQYEGKQATSGFIVYRERLKDFQTSCSMSDCLIQDFDPSIGISADFFKNPLAHLLVNGMGSFYACNLRLRATGTLKFMNYGNRDAVDRLSQRDALSLLGKSGDGAFAAGIAASSELEVMTAPDKILVWRRGAWGLFDPDVYRMFLSGHLEARQAESLILTVYTMSKLRLGTVILISDEGVLASGNLKKGAVAGQDPLGQLLVGFHKHKSISSLKHSGVLLSILSADGMTVFNRSGKLLDTGVIVNTCVTPGLVTGGARTTAATAASLLGKVIKVSEDGPVELYEHGGCVYRFG